MKEKMKREKEDEKEKSEINECMDPKKGNNPISRKIW